MRVVFEEYWQHLRQGMEEMGVTVPPHDLDAFVGEMRERGVAEVRLCLRWLHVLNVEAVGGALPAGDALSHSPFMQYGTYALVTARDPEGTVYEYRQRLYPEDGQAHDFVETLRARLADAGFHIRAGRWQY